MALAPGGTERLGYRPSLDLVRGIAVLLVIALHYAGPIRRFFPGAGIGVNVFFVLSGFLITRLLLEEYDKHGRIHIRQFMRRRIARLAPALLTLVAAIAIAEFGFGIYGQPGAVLRGIVATLVHARNWLTVAGQGEPALGIAWSLSIEEQFYLVWPAVFLLAARRARVLHLAIGIAVVSVAATAIRSIVFNTDVQTLKFSTEANGLLTVMTGCALAAILPTVVSSARHRRNLRIAGLLGAFVLAGYVFGVDSTSTLNPRGGWALVALASAAVIAALVAGCDADWGSRGFGWLRWVGLRSYALYLWHLPAFAVTRAVTDNFVLQRVVALTATLAIAELSMRLIERPARRWILSRGRPTPAPTVTDLRETVELRDTESNTSKHQNRSQ